MQGAAMNRLLQLRLPRNPVLRALAVLGLAALAVLLFFLGAVIWLGLLAIGLVATLLLRLFGPRVSSQPPGGVRGEVIEGQFEVVGDASPRDGQARRLPDRGNRERP
jgi:hypothetical protein